MDRLNWEILQAIHEEVMKHQQQQQHSDEYNEGWEKAMGLAETIVNSAFRAERKENEQNQLQPGRSD